MRWHINSNATYRGGWSAHDFDIFAEIAINSSPKWVRQWHRSYYGWGKHQMYIYGKNCIA